ncbi:50S ribosomal protein L24 [Candidatus Parcubacteria bacterium]|nr:50S ribosomal protein L24 [Candidatus Parcubacteria bacterium]
MKIKTNDKVIITTGKDKGKKGKVIKVISERNRVVVEGVNFIKKHIKARRQGEKGQKITVPVPINISNISMICPKCNKQTRIGYLVLENGEKHRICKKCKENIDIQIEK